LADMTAFNEELVAAGVMLTGEGLHPSSQGARVAFRGGETTVTPGPFSDPENLVAGFWIWQLDSLEEAVGWLERSPFARGVDAEVEIRRVMEDDDFGEALTPELRAAEARMRARLRSERP
jgi:hypothetical protein